ncbi:MAG TPA: DUF6084 family protein [Mycobacteriales bacterium]|nr:DUF6084 family protein [Mycobacteriales bacterium]
MTGRPDMVDLGFVCVGARPAPTAAIPTLLLDLEVSEPSGRRVYGIGLRCQIRIEPVRRRYAAAEAEALLDLFGETRRWGDTLKPIQVSTISLMVPGFTGRTRVEIGIPCTYDTEVAAAKYFRALDEGEIPLLLLFSGSVFYAGGDGLVVEPVPWDREVTYRLPVATWRALMDAHFPGTGWIRMRADTVAALEQFRRSGMYSSWDDTFAALLEARVVPT